MKKNTLGILMILVSLAILTIAFLLSAKPTERYWEVRVKVYLASGKYDSYTYTINAHDSATARRRAQELARRQIEFQIVSYKEIKPKN